MAYCGTCGTFVGEDGLCPNCHEVPAQPFATNLQPVPNQQPAPIQQAGAQQVPAQQATPIQQAPAVQAAPAVPVTIPVASPPFAGPAEVTSTSTPLVVTGIILLAIGLYDIATSIHTIFVFLSFFNSGGLAVGNLNVFPWLPVIYTLIVYVVMAITGLLALILSKKASRTMILTIAAALTFVLLLIGIVGSSTDFFSTLLSFGPGFLDTQSSILFGLVRVPYVVTFTLSAVLDVLAVGAAVILFVFSIKARKKR